jgi:hypothetical protein
MKDTAELEAKVRKEARDRMQRVQSLGGYDATSKRWQHFRPAESMGRPQLLPLSAHTVFYNTHNSGGKAPGHLLPSLHAASVSGNQKADSLYSAGRQPGLQLGNTPGQTMPGCWVAANSGLPNDYAFPRGFPIPGMSTTGFCSYIEFFMSFF